MPEEGVAFVGLYVGNTVTNARLLAVSADPVVVGDVARRLAERGELQDVGQVLRLLESGRRAALRLVQRNASRPLVSEAALTAELALNGPLVAPGERTLRRVCHGKPAANLRFDVLVARRCERGLPATQHSAEPELRACPPTERRQEQEDHHDR